MRFAGAQELYLPALRRSIEERGRRVVPHHEDGLDVLLAEYAKGSVALGPQDLRNLARMAVGPRKTEVMSPARKLAEIGEYLSTEYGLAPLIFPVRDRNAIYGASIYDGDTAKINGLSPAELAPPGMAEALGMPSNAELAFMPVVSAPDLTHVVERAPDGGYHHGVMATPRARGIYQAARGSGYEADRNVIEDFWFDEEVRNYPGPAVMGAHSLLKALGYQ